MAKPQTSGRDVEDLEDWLNEPLVFSTTHKRQYLGSIEYGVLEQERNGSFEIREPSSSQEDISAAAYWFVRDGNRSLLKLRQEDIHSITDQEIIGAAPNGASETLIGYTITRRNE